MIRSKVKNNSITASLKNETIRAFIALDFPNEAFSFFSEQQRRLRPLFNDARIAWVNPTNIHITLALLGEINRVAIPKITRGLSDLNEAGSFYLVATHLGFFSTKGNPKVLWIGFKKSSTIESLQNKICIRLNALGLTTEDKKFIPHATLARLRDWPSAHLAQQNAINQFIGETEWGMPTLTLYESVLQRQGAQYKPLFQIKFT